MADEQTEMTEESVESGELESDQLETDPEFLDALDRLTAALTKKRDHAVAFRASSGVERRWREDEQLFEGSLQLDSGKNAMLDYATGEAPARLSSSPNRSMVEVNVIRSKCETAEGRFSDITLPTNGKNWGLSVTPVPELTKAVNDNRKATLKGTNQPIKNQAGQPIKVSDVAQSDMQKAKDAMKLMETEIHDQLTECDFNAENRKLIKSSCRLGTGVLKGPNVVKRVKQSYKEYSDGTDSIHMLEAIEENRPASEWVSCWNIFPDPDTTEDTKKTMTYLFERGTIRPNELIELMDLPGYLPKQILKVLQEKPVKTVVSTDRDSQNSNLKAKQEPNDLNDLYERWEFYGYLGRDDLEALGVDVSLTPEAFKLSVAVVMVNDHPIKVMLNPLDAGCFPYDFFQWTQISGSPWGIGLPRMMMWLQRIINGAMRSMMDNAGDSSGVNVVIGGDLEPVDGKLELTGKKLWRYVGEDPQEIDVKKLFAQFQVENNQAELQNIIELAFKLLDLETGVPMIFQGEQQKIPETLGATNIMVDASNVSLRSRVKLYDDQITDPHLTKYYHWNMQYSSKNEIKGDYCVDAKGASELIQRDQDLKFLTQLMNFKADPDFNLRVDWDKAITQMFDIIGLDVLKSDAEFKQAQTQAAQQKKPADPRVQTAQIKAKTDMEEVQAKGSIKQAEFQFKQSEAEKNRAHEMQLKMLERDIKMMEFAKDQNISLDRVKADLSKEAMKLDTQIKLTDSGGKAPQVTTPSVEPPERAPDGEAFTK